MENLIPRLLRFIDVEYDTEIASTDELWKLPLEERVAKGEAIQNLKAQFISMTFGSSKFYIGVRFTCDANISKFREGTPVVVSGHGIKFKGEISNEKRNTIEIEINQYDGYPSVPNHLVQSDGWVIDKAKTDIRHILKQPIQNLSTNPSRFNLINGILNGNVSPQLDESLRRKAEQLTNNAQLNDSQRKAFIEAYIAKNYYLIQGPPGTGKTWVLAYLASAFASEGKNVLVTAFTHTGINNALQKISKVTGYKKTAKLGKKHQSENIDYDGASVSSGEDLRANGYDYSTRGVIIGATAYAPNTKKLKGFPFDVIIFDEASQLTIPLAVAAMAAGTKFIFIGDHKQLPPIISPQQQDTELSTSIFEYLFQFSKGTMLSTTYRMNNEINAFPSKSFYNSQLKTDISSANNRINFKVEPEIHANILDRNKPDVFVDLSHSDMTTYCKPEALLIAELVIESIRCGIRPKDIAVIAPYRAQVRLIKNAIEDLASDKTAIKGIFIDTVERIQGQERDLVIFSLTTSSQKHAVEKADFFFMSQRLNVALTRAKCKRIVVGSSHIFQSKSDIGVIQKYIDIFKDYYESTYVVQVEEEVTEDLF